MLPLAGSASNPVDFRPTKVLFQPFVSAPW